MIVGLDFKEYQLIINIRKCKDNIYFCSKFITLINERKKSSVILQFNLRGILNIAGSIVYFGIVINALMNILFLICLVSNKILLYNYRIF